MGIHAEMSRLYCSVMYNSAMTAHTIGRDMFPAVNRLRQWITTVLRSGLVSSNAHDMIYALLEISVDW